MGNKDSVPAAVDARLDVAGTSGSYNTTPADSSVAKVATNSTCNGRENTTIDEQQCEQENAPLMEGENTKYVQQQFVPEW